MTGMLVVAVLTGVTAMAIGQAMTAMIRYQAKWEMKERAKDSLEIVAKDYDPNSETWPSVSLCTFEVIDFNDTEQWDEVEATCKKGEFVEAKSTKIVHWDGKSNNGNGNGKSNNGDGNNLEDCDPSNPANGESCENQEDVELNG